MNPRETIGNETHSFRKQKKDTDIDHRHWVVMSPWLEYGFKVGPIPYVKLVVDIDPDNTCQEAQRRDGNNRCVASW